MPICLLVAKRCALWLIALIELMALIALPLLLGISPWLALIPIALWGAVGWALQVPQNNELMKAREAQGERQPGSGFE
ncbi:hypothetical protein V6R97_13275 [Chromohalobacter salexigens]|uniref:hypothetical protein n=1 Tax=Chromohalobacter israelensis TaxID=141390 RepID=UPI0032E852B2